MTEAPAGPLRGQHAVVTGGGRGLGAAIASAIAAAGANVTLMGRTTAAIEEHADALRRTAGVRAQAIVCDVSDAAVVRSAFVRAASDLGPVQVLVNNAGQADVGPFASISIQTWNAMLAVNLTGTFLCCQQVLSAMVESGSGRIVNVASTAALKGYPRTAAYSASKHGVVGLTRALAAETAKTGVTVNAVCPGYVDDTDMLRAAVDNVMHASGRTEDEARARLAKQSPRGTLITPREVADAVLWLCSPGASGITGQAIAVAAGEVMR